MQGLDLVIGKFGCGRIARLFAGCLNSRPGLAEKMAKGCLAAAQGLDHPGPDCSVHGQRGFARQPVADFSGADAQFGGQRRNPLVAIEREAGEAEEFNSNVVLGLVIGRFVETGDGGLLPYLLLFAKTYTVGGRHWFHAGPYHSRRWAKGK